MALGSITSWQIDGETVTDFIFGGSRITADGDCSHEIKRCLLLGRKAMTNLDSILKSRNIALPTKVRLVKALVFPVVMYECESWTIKKAEHWRIDAFELWCWRRLLRVLWTARRSNQSTGRTEAEAPILWPPDMKNWLIGKDPDAGKDWKQEEKRTTEDEMVGWRHRLNGCEFEQALGVDDGSGSLRATAHGVAKSWAQLSNWTDWLYLARGSSYGNCLPKPMSLCSLAPRQLDISRSCQYSETGKTEPIRLSRSLKVGVLDMWTNSFFLQGKLRARIFFNANLVLSYREQWQWLLFQATVSVLS